MIRLLIAPVSRLRGYFPPVMGSVILVLCCSVSAAAVLNGCNSAATTGRTSGPAEPPPLDINPAANSVIPSDGGGALSLIRRATPEPTNSFYSIPSDGLAPTVATTAAPTVVARPPETTPTGTQPDRFPTLLANADPAVEPEPLFIPTLTVAPVQANTPLLTDKTTPAQTPSPAPTGTQLPIVTPTPSPVPTSTPQPTTTHTPTAAPVPTNTPQPTAMPTPTPAPAPTSTPQPTATPTPTMTPTSSPQPTATPAPTSTPTSTPQPTPTPTLAPTSTPWPTATPTPTVTPTSTPQPTPTPTPTNTPQPTPIAAPTPTLEPSVDSGGCSGDQVDVNSAPVEELDRIIHIGPARAAQMVTLRPFTSLDDLVRIKGIATARLADIKAEGIACVAR